MRTIKMSLWLTLAGLGAIQCAPTRGTGRAGSTGPMTEPSPRPSSYPAISARSAAAKSASKVIVFVWDGLRPDSVSPALTPNLARLRDQEGVNFTDHHSVYPTFTMMNAASLATGSLPGTHGFFGNTLYLPGANGTKADGKPIDFANPVFTEDYGVIQAIDRYAVSQREAGALLAPTLFQMAHARGMRTAALGKTGPTFLFDYRLDGKDSVFLDENLAYPLSFARALETAGFKLPQNTARYPYPDAGQLELGKDNGNPTGSNEAAQIMLKDGATTDPRAASGSPHNARNHYLMQVYLDFVLPKIDPDLSLVWLRNPDSTEHGFGPGSPNHRDALRDQDELLGKLLKRLKELSLDTRTDLLILSDHGHSTVAGDPQLFPPRLLKGNADGSGDMGDPSSDGYPVSGEVRTVELLKRAGIQHIYDGSGCRLDPVLSGIKKNGSLLYPVREDARGAVCHPGSGSKDNAHYTTGFFKISNPIERDAVVIAANGGSEYLYLNDPSPKRMQALVSALQEREVYGPIFVASRYGAIPGTFPLAAIHAEAARATPPAPDLIVSYDWDSAQRAGTAEPGTEYASAQGNRGMHGSFSPVDVHNTLIASGPHFKAGYADIYPTGNVDIAKTVGALLGLPFTTGEGRILLESFKDQNPKFSLQIVTETAPPAALRRVCRADDPDCTHPGRATTLRVELRKKILTAEDPKTHSTYFDQAKATRGP